jgi:hypothetical protein
MEKNTLIEKIKVERIEISREGILRKEVTGDYWIDHIKPSFHNKDIAEAAIKAGYQVGDLLRYRIIIEPKE